MTALEKSFIHNMPAVFRQFLVGAAACLLAGTSAGAPAHSAITPVIAPPITLVKPKKLNSENIASRAKVVAEATRTVGYCYNAVCRALRPLGVELSGAAAYQAHVLLAQDPRFMPLSFCIDRLRRGDIVVYTRSASHPYGHISVYQGNYREASDHMAAITKTRAYGNATVFRLKNDHSIIAASLPQAREDSQHKTFRAHHTVAEARRMLGKHNFLSGKHPVFLCKQKGQSRHHAVLVCRHEVIRNKRKHQVLVCRHEGLKAKHPALLCRHEIGKGKHPVLFCRHEIAKGKQRMLLCRHEVSRASSLQALCKREGPQTKRALLLCRQRTRSGRSSVQA